MKMKIKRQLRITKEGNLNFLRVSLKKKHKIKIKIRIQELKTKRKIHLKKNEISLLTD